MGKSNLRRRAKIIRVRKKNDLDDFWKNCISIERCCNTLHALFLTMKVAFCDLYPQLSVASKWVLTKNSFIPSSAQTYKHLLHNPKTPGTETCEQRPGNNLNAFHFIT